MDSAVLEQRMLQEELSRLYGITCLEMRQNLKTYKDECYSVADHLAHVVPIIIPGGGTCSMSMECENIIAVDHLSQIRQVYGSSIY